MPRHSKLYFSDGTIVIKAGDGSDMFYNVYRGPLEHASELFDTLLNLPQPGIPPMTWKDNAITWFQKARSLGLNGSTDALALELPAQLTAGEIEAWIYFTFLQDWAAGEPSVETARAILKTSHFLIGRNGIAYARRVLDKSGTLNAIERLVLGFNYGFARWVKDAFDELMSVPINDLSEADEAAIGSVAYRALAKTQAKVTDARLNLAFRPPDVNHCNACINHFYCQGEWEQMWTSPRDGVLAALIKDELPGSVILEQLRVYRCGGMNLDCHRRTCDGLRDTVDKISILKEEEGLIDNAIMDLLAHAGIPAGELKTG
ncbi:hypothetical protein R3P38DRAFT_2492395 [Favolaschia claudopus]|uniref:Cyclic nucleotide-binding domain-containing protein n=1 Tax=Favolaschia claudopus TaxID=2862362 RepID=A0AAW0EH81_9AGAR